MSGEGVPGTRSVWWGRSSRAASGLVVVGLTVAVVVAGARMPGSSDDPVAAARISVPPALSTLVCAGPLIQPDDTGRGDSAFDPTPVDPVTTVTAVTSVPDGEPGSAGTVGSLDRSATTATLAPGGSTAVVTGTSGPQVVLAEPGAAPARVAASAAGLVTAGDLRGLSAASCQQPTADAWLLGGATDLTSTAQLVLDNAGSTPAEVTLELWGPSGPVDLSGERFLVAPGAQRVVVLGGVAAEQRRLALHVTATGGRVGVHVQDSALDGFTPAGTDLVVPGAAPARRQVVPGVAVVTSAVDDPAVSALRLLVPGETATTARVTLLGPAGATVLPGAEALALVPGEVTDIPLGGLPAGAYTVVVDADEPVLAAAVLTRPGTVGELDDVPSVERAWAASTPVGRSGVVAVPDGTSGTLVVGAVSGDTDPAAGGEATATLRLLGADGAVLAERRLRLAAGTTASWSVDDLAAGSGDVAVADPAAPPAPPAGVVGVDLVTEDGADVGLAWALVAEVARPDGFLVSVLDPVPVPRRAADVAVREDPRFGTR
ncbi:DUF5719 family protein [Cellulomonas fengjieae]|uniref:Large extracellular alpha-helical protein n=1 Tax=Cellulomonas fengjieae TaxID=2819978 RepID=A0ABS3SDN6_9CELL|nr:DUF5719 family protein [Cellulomonas fengjieae]MBO3083868.1 hypothetical protein [Cellulomonas fengjieae]MBO3101380.1 hypothetical protein [Cellulomonas fengjieae]QVI64847.1 hypothetical protein KG102_11850 [Cellulomonas fengjieae]